MKYKRIAVFLLIFLLAGCARTGADSNEKKLITVGFSQLGAESDWRIANTASMMQVFTQRNGYEMLYDNAMQRQENQFLAVRNFILQGVDIIVLAPASEMGWEEVLREAKQADIPVIIVDREVDVADDSLYLTGVGSDFLAEGNRAVEWLENEVSARESTESPIRILHLKGTDGATAQLMRTKAIEEAAQRHEDWDIAGQLSCDYTEAKAYEEVRDFLKSDRDIDVIYSENDNMTFGAMRALEEAGISYGTEGDVILISFDAVREALQYCMEGRINLCVECNPLHGPRVDELIRQYLKGEEIPKQIYVEENIFTPDTVTEELIRSREY